MLLIQGEKTKEDVETRAQKQTKEARWERKRKGEGGREQVNEGEMGGGGGGGNGAKLEKEVEGDR